MRILKIALLTTALSVPVAAHASNFYVGLEGTYTQFNFETTAITVGAINNGTPNALYGMNVFGGYHLFKHLSLEAGVGGGWAGGGFSGVGRQEVFANAVFGIPIFKWMDIDIVPGATWGSQHIGFGDCGCSFRDYSIGWKVGMGPDIRISPDLNWRTIVSYKQPDFTSVVADVSVSSGLVWNL